MSARQQTDGLPRPNAILRLYPPAKLLTSAIRISSYGRSLNLSRQLLRHWAKRRPPMLQTVTDSVAALHAGCGQTNYRYAEDGAIAIAFRTLLNLWRMGARIRLAEFEKSVRLRAGQAHGCGLWLSGLVAAEPVPGSVAGSSV